MKLFGRELSLAAKVLLVLVAILILSAGMCGLQLNSRSQLSSNSEALLILLGIVELAAMFLSAVGIVVVLLALAARGLRRRSQRMSGIEIQERSSGESPTKRNDSQ